MQTIYIFYNKKTISYFEDYINSLVSVAPQNLLIRTVPWSRISKLVIKLDDILVFIRKIPKELLKFLGYRKHYLLNTEQLSRKMMYETVFRDINENTGILDYSLANIEIMKTIKGLEGKNIKYLPYQINDKEIKNYDKVYNVCMMDGVTERRLAVMEKIKMIPQSNIVKGFGQSRDNLLFRHKILVNIHANDDFNVFEQMRCNRCILNKMIVISEPSLYEQSYELEKYVIVCPYNEIMEKVLEVLENYESYYNKMFGDFSVDDLRDKYGKISDIIV